MDIYHINLKMITGYSEYMYILSRIDKHIYDLINN